MPDRFDRFTERAKTVITLAQQESQRLQHNYIGTEHLLLGLVREGGGLAAKVLATMDIDLATVRSKVEAIVSRGKKTPYGKVGMTPRAKKVIELAVDEARRLNHHYIGTEHLLLGLLREGEGIGAGVLEDLGVDLQRTRREVILALEKPLPSVPGNLPARPTAVILTTLAIVAFAAIALRRRISRMIR